MRNTVLICACSDLGVEIDGAKTGPLRIIERLDERYKNKVVMLMQDERYTKSHNPLDLKKNLVEINKYNNNLYKLILESIDQDKLPIVLGGDHSIAIASVLAEENVKKDIGLIWFDAHTDYNTFESTVTGNIHGLPLATINFYGNDNLRKFYNGKPVLDTKTVVVGARSIDELEIMNLRKTNVKVFSTKDICKNGAKKITEKAFEIAGNRTNGVHISFDLDLIDPAIAPGVSVPEKEGIDESQLEGILEIIDRNIDMITGIDIVELNPRRDIDDKTLKIAVQLVNRILHTQNS